MNIVLNGLARTVIPVQYPGYSGYVGATAGAATGIAGFFFFLMIIIIIITIALWLLGIFGIYKIIIKAGYPSDKALIYTLLFAFIPIVNLVLFYLFAFKEDWPILQQIRALRGEKSYSQPVSATSSGINTTKNIPPTSPLISPKQASGVIKCPNCGAEVLKGSRFCKECGGEIIINKQGRQNKKCPNCGTENTPDAGFCENCGKPL
ncbi:MAG: zinc-ribbon domain-containing protein [Deltaproteobacteria bacterium]|nr:zinc-ribbon domain-containing protein [Deltaproteobacteria bacterium]